VTESAGGWTSSNPAFSSVLPGGTLLESCRCSLLAFDLSPVVLRLLAVRTGIGRSACREMARKEGVG
jgi:hypothetical protein